MSGFVRSCGSKGLGWALLCALSACAGPSAGDDEAGRAAAGVGDAETAGGMEQSLRHGSGAKSMLGGMLYADKSLSRHGNQSCLTCHDPRAAFADPANTRDPAHSVVSTGSDGVSLGGREAPSAAYAAFSPPFGAEVLEDGSLFYTGGQFWDGRASTLADQAKAPFLNPKEMAMPDKASVVAQVRRAPYAGLFRHVYGRGTLDDVERAYDAVADAIATFESGRFVNRFSSRYDAWLAGRSTLTTQEQRGLALFEGKAGCAACHPSQPGPDGSPPQFTDFSYDNPGIPRSTNPQLAGNPTDYGLGGRADIAAEDPVDVVDPVSGLAVTVSAGQAGKHKVMGLRNIARTAPYGHNGYFATLEDVVDFYNTASDPRWPAPEVDMNVNRDELGALGLTGEEVADVAAFLRALSDE